MVFLFSVADKAGFRGGNINKFTRCFTNGYGEAKIDELYS